MNIFKKIKESLSYKNNLELESEIEINPLFKYKKMIKLQEAGQMVIVESKKVKELLDAKGFSYSRDTVCERIALLHTEVAELTDAFKKGKGKDEEGEEIADIFIRLMNIPCMFPKIEMMIDKMIENCNKEEQLDEDASEKNMVGFSYTYVTKMDDLSKVKYFITYSLHTHVTELGNHLQALNVLIDTPTNKIRDEIRKEYYIKIIYEMFNIILHCKMYTEEILNLKLQELINKKMEKNHQRPYRFNTSPELFK